MGGECHKEHTGDDTIAVVDVALPKKDMPSSLASNLPSIVTPTRTKFEVGKEVVADIPHSEDAQLVEFSGFSGIVQTSEMTSDGRVYEVSFNMRSQVQVGSTIVMKGR